MPNLIGPDVSFYQDDNATERMIDFAKMESNAGYIIIRSGQNLWADPDFKLNWQTAKGVLPRGSYWFYDSRVEPKRQADLWVSLFPSTGSGHRADDFGELPLFCDFEDNYDGQYGRWQDWYDFIEGLKSLLPAGKEIGIYTAYYYWLERTVVKGIPAASLEYFKQYPLWVANYKVEKPLVPKPWTEWTFWQYTDKGDGSLYGVESKNIDLNYFNGDMDAFRTRFQLTPKPAALPMEIDKTDFKFLVVYMESGEQITFVKRGE